MKPVTAGSRRSLHCVLLVFACVCGLTACATQTTKSAASTDAVENAPAAAPAPAFVDTRWPVSVEAYRTTNEAIYLANLDSRISEYQRVSLEHPSASLETGLASALYHRFKIIGKIDDAERAMDLVDAAVREEPDEASHRLLRATVYSAFHRFVEAEADLVLAAKSSDLPEIRQAQREIDLALGRYDRLAAEFDPLAAPTDEFSELVHRADLALMQGDLASANVLFRTAQIQYRDVNPVPLAWLHVQRGIGSLRYGDRASALRFFAAAHERMPHYYLATEHLAEVLTALRRFNEARPLYQSVIAQTGNPEFIAALAALEQAAGNTQAAATRNIEAKSAYAALYARHPDAYAQHYAEFLLAAAEPAQALVLAERNVRLRQDVGSWILLARAAEANQDRGLACDAHRNAVATGRNPPELTQLSALAARCRESSSAEPRS
ncbi:MAG: tetratricopeptide repeat protein [Lysobacterales bacterium]